MQITFADLSSGGGLASLGLVRGLRARGAQGIGRLAVDPWAPAAATYKANLPGVPFAQTTTEDALARGLVPYVDLVITGPPCQGDSTLNRCYIEVGKRPEKRGKLGKVKLAAAEIGLGKGRLVVMETVSDYWAAWGRSLGGQIRVLHDDQLGGVTVRKRTFIFLGFQHELPPTDWVKAGLVPARGWGRALPHWAKPGLCLASEADKAWKHEPRWAGITYTEASKAAGAKGGLGYCVPSHLPTRAVLGHGSAHRVYRVQPWAYLHRCDMRESAALQGHPNMRIVIPNAPDLDSVVPWKGLKPGAAGVRTSQTLVGNGWPASYGAYVAQAVLGELGPERGLFCGNPRWMKRRR